MVKMYSKKLLNNHQNLILMGGWGLSNRLPGSWLSHLADNNCVTVTLLIVHY